MTGTRWVGMYAFYASNSTLVAGCVRYRARSEADPANARYFGGCGAPPAAAPQLPTRVCADGALAQKAQPQPCLNVTAPAMELNATLDAPVKCGGVSTRAAAYRGMRCGPGLRWVRWSSVTLPEGGRACRFSRNNTDLRWNAQWLGQCGVPPQFAMALPARVCGVPEEAPLPAPSSPWPRTLPRPSPAPAAPAPPSAAPPPVPSPLPPSSSLPPPAVVGSLPKGAPVPRLERGVFPGCVRKRAPPTPPLLHSHPSTPPPTPATQPRPHPAPHP
jgi:hypothetical protein